ncbi:hypothetical protein IEQ34_004373 [Dendrobium chrysotoxum]|uniref:Uncharacterized protein n=1 Tax=Dendrobium chrysotoxum TaxID=161865 RepID=A0AAV7HI66_DENCH|nr:hypothetical protein IEQ34_004373 [Dendrobium chrysotoxum]
MEGFTSLKRSREDTDSSPEAKRIHADLLLNMLSEDDSDTGDCNPAHQDLATVIKSLEEEISLPPAIIASEIEATKVGIEYLQEASDDELGIPPPEAASSAGDGEEDETAEGFGRIWVFEDEVIPAWYEGFVEFGFLTAEDCGDVVDGGGGGSAVLFDGGIGDFMGCY